DMFVPIMGRSGILVDSEIFIAVFVSVAIFWIMLGVYPYVQKAIGGGSMVTANRILVCIVLVFIVIACFTFPFKENKPLRVYGSHSHYIDTKSGKEVKSRFTLARADMYGLQKYVEALGEREVEEASERTLNVEFN